MKERAAQAKGYKEASQPSLATARRPEALDNLPYPPRRSGVEEQHETCP